MYKIKLSPYAKIFYTEWQLNPDSSVYNIVMDQMLCGVLEVERLREALKKYVLEQVLLNSHIQEVGGEPHWVRNDNIYELEYVDSSISKSELLAFVREKFELYSGPLYRFKLIRINEDIYRFIVVLHHILLDALSLNEGVFTAITNYYNKPNYVAKYGIEEQVGLITNLVSTLSFRVIQNQDKYKNFWHQHLSGVEGVDFRFLKLSHGDGGATLLQIDNPMIQLGFSYGAAELSRLNQIKGYVVTPYIYSLCIFALLLYRYTGQEKFAIAYPVAIRDGVDFIYGAQVNTSLIVYQFGQIKTIKDLFEKTLEFFGSLRQAGVSYNHYPIINMVSSKNKELLDVWFTQANMRDTFFDFDGVTKVEVLTDLHVDTVADDVPLFEQELINNELHFRVRFNKRFINEELLKNFVASYKKLFLEVLDGLIRGNDRLISNYSLLDERQYLQVVYKLNQTEKDYPRDATIHELFEKQALGTPNNIAVVHEDIKLTYKELNDRANQLAHYLVNNYKIKPDDLVAICLDRSEQMVVAILGVLKSGGAYVPLDSSFPNERIGYILDDAKPKVILTSVDYQKRLQQICQAKVKVLILAIDDTSVQAELAQQRKLNPSAIMISSNLVYVFYTSGTTGVPKGVMLEHRSCVNRILEMIGASHMLGNEKVLFKTNYVFDVSFSDIFTALLTGASLVVTKNVFDIDEIAAKFVNYSIDVCHFTPSQFELITYIYGMELFDKLKILNFSGEALYPKILKGLDKKVFCANYYGPTEAGEVTFENIKLVRSRGSVATIGKALHNIKLLVLDRYLMPLPVGAIGELYLGGICLARGYLNNPQLTNTRFIINPLQTAQEKLWGVSDRLYRTGDLVRWLPDGNIEYVGRSDSQIKIRGHRVELGEIEHRLLQFVGIRQAVVVVKESKNDNKNDKRLLAYYVADKALDEEKIQTHLAMYLPGYMLPNTLTFINTLPLTANGKLDISALPEPKSAVGLKRVAPKTKVQKKITEILAEILDISKEVIGIKDNFFSLGGNSLAAIRLTNAINQQFRNNIQVRDVLNNSTIEILAKMVSANVSQFIYSDYVIEHIDIGSLYEPFELTNVQQAYYLGRFGSFTLGNVSAHVYIEYEFKFLDVSKLEIALNKLIARHHNLRMIFEDGKQHYVEHYPHYQVKFYKLNDKTELESIRREYSHKVYAVDKLWLFDMFVSNLKNKYVLHFSLDALIFDAYSLWIFLNELSGLYKDPLHKLPELIITFRDYIRQAALIRQSCLFTEARQYWLDRIDDYNFNFTLPLQKQPNAITYPKFARISKELDAKTWEKIVIKANHYSIGLTAIIMHIYGHVLSYWSNQNKLCINLTLFNRLPLHEQVNKLVGDFTVLELFNYVDDEPSIKHDLLAVFKSTHNRLWDDIEHNLFDGLDFQRLVRERLSLSLHDKIIAPVVLTSVFGIDYGNKKILDESCNGIGYSITQTSQVWLDNKAYERDGKMVAEWDYVEELFNRKDIESMHDHYFSLIKYLADADWERDILPSLKPPRLSQDLIKKANVARQPIGKDTLFGRYESFVSNNGLGEEISVIDCGDNDKIYKYRDLLEGSNLLARYILANINTNNVGDKKSVTDTKLVAILSGRGYNQVLGTLSIMKAGFGYLPLNVDWPQARMEEILVQAGAQVLLISREQYIKLRNRFSDKYLLIVIEDILEFFSHNELKRNDLLKINLPRVKADDVAYVIFTSGSTGTPKGATISHRGALNTIDAINNKFNITKQDQVLAISELSFDLSVYDIFGMLAVGGKIIFPAQHKTKEPKYWVELIKYYRITIWNTVPQLAGLLIDELDIAHSFDIPSLRLFLLSGDWVPIGLSDRIKKYCKQARVISLGGATEGSIWSIWYEIDQVRPEWSSIPYGMAMPNQKMYILNRLYQHCPVGVIGEIYIGGTGVALNYWHDQIRTDASFIEHPQFGRIYKTGDLGRWDSNGYMEFMGRRDTQVKIRGYRIELGDIEEKLKEYPGVTQVVVLVKDHVNRGKYLVAYYVAPSKLNDDAIKNSLQEKLPDYMVPSILIHLTKLPLTTNGKLDFAVLSTLASSQFANINSYVAPSNDLEYKICAGYSEVLGLSANQVGVNDDFFAYGGDSVLAIRLVSKLQQYIKISLPDLFQLKTPARIAQRIPMVDDDFSLHQKLEQVKQLYQVQKPIEADLIAANLKRDKYLKKVEQLTFKPQLKNIHNVLLTGATGFLGCNILYQLLTTTSYKIYLVVRGSSEEQSYERISNKFCLYFDVKLSDYKDRIVVLKANLEYPNLGLEAKQYNNLVESIDSIIHAAALVKYHGNYDVFYKSNVQATINLLELAKLTANKDFHYISTNGLFLDGYVPNCSYYVFNEDDTPELLLGSDLVYLKTKYEGEVVTRDYRKYGVTSNIYRVGNLTAHSTNYRNQENINDSAFFHCTRTILTLKALPKELSLVEMSPVDCTALGIVKIFNQVHLGNQTHHVFNPKRADLHKLFSAYSNLCIREVSIDKFIDIILEKFDNSSYRDQIELFMLHHGWLQRINYSNLTNVEVLQDRTDVVLSHLGFKWPKIIREMLFEFVNTIVPAVCAVSGQSVRSPATHGPQTSTAASGVCGGPF